MPGYTSLFDFVLAQYFLIDRIFNLDVVSVVAVNQFPQFPHSKLSVYLPGCPHSSGCVTNFCYRDGCSVFVSLKIV